jgi:hypothetical protein
MRMASNGGADMKAATVRARRRLADGRRLIQIVCPHCEHRHWLPESPNGWCSRRNSAFTIATERTNA